ncbi:MAG: YeeE/YedE family protein [Pirellulaceae bacterium]|jgi:uncharacterized protein|nr:YeeE/YedE family protein [Pirellulaceae bacterium]
MIGSNRYWHGTVALILGTYFGIVMTKAEVVRWERVHDMFLFREAHMYLIITTAIVVAAVSLAILKGIQARGLSGEAIKYKPKPFHPGVIIGGICFGAGWSMTGACPGPIYAQIGGLEWMAWFTLLGAVLGVYLYAVLKPMLPH